MQAQNVNAANTHHAAATTENTIQRLSILIESFPS
jgi:hypothetical protein